MELKDQLTHAAELHQGADIAALLQAALQHMAQQDDESRSAKTIAAQALTRMNSLALSLQELSNEMASLLVLHLQRDPVAVYNKLDVLAARYVRSGSNPSLDAMAMAAGKVH